MKGEWGMLVGKKLRMRGRGEEKRKQGRGY